MLTFGWQELVLVAFVLVLVVGPKDMPRVMRALSNGLARMRVLANEFRTAMIDAANTEEAKQAKRMLDDALHDTKADVKARVTDAVGDDVADSVTETLAEAGKIAGEIKGKPNKIKIAASPKTKPSKPRQDNAKTKTRRSA